MTSRSFSSVDELEQSISNYLIDCEEKEKPITILGFCVFCDISKETMNVYAKGEYDTDDESYSDPIKRFKDRVELDKQEGLLMGKYNPTGAIFDLKNNHGWTDKIDATVVAREMTHEEWLETIK